MFRVNNHKSKSAVAPELPVPRRNDPYKSNLSVLPESSFAKSKSAAQEWAQANHTASTTIESAFRALVESYHGNDRSLSALHVLVEASPMVEKAMHAFITDRIWRGQLEELSQRARMADRGFILDHQSDLVALTFGQLPLTGLSDAALYVLINMMVPGAAVFVTAAAHAKMRSHGLRFVVVWKNLADQVKDLMHHRLLFALDRVCILSIWAATYNGFKTLAEILSIRDNYLRAAVCSRAGDAQSKLTGGAWPITVQDCRKEVSALADFADPSMDQ